MGFDAASVVEPLDWTFVKITNDPADQGTITEPDDRMIDSLFKGLATLNKELQAKLQTAITVTPETAMEVVSKMPDGSESDFGVESYLEELNHLFAAVCSGSPSAAQLARLPLRFRMPFFTWLMGELRPNNFGGASTTPALKLVKPA
jgi:hypothetical protein